MTKADIVANKFILRELKQIFPQYKIVSEENSQTNNLLAAKENEYFMIDPLDGTSSFIKKSDEFTVNIAFIKNKKAVFGSIYLPVQDILYYTDENNDACQIKNYSKNNTPKTTISVSTKTNQAKIICTKREPEKSEIIADLRLRNIQIENLLSVSSSYKFCLIAEGKADLYPRRANINAWDIAAGHAIINAANGKVINLHDQQEVTYNFKIPFFECS